MASAGFQVAELSTFAAKLTTCLGMRTWHQELNPRLAVVCAKVVIVCHGAKMRIRCVEGASAGKNPEIKQEIVGRIRKLEDVCIHVASGSAASSEVMSQLIGVSADLSAAVQHARWLVKALVNK